MEDHERGTSYPILQYLSAFRHKPLGGGQAVEYVGSIPVKRFYMRAYVCVFYKVGLEVVAEDVLGDIVLGGTESAGGEYDIGARERLVKGRDDMLAVVVYGRDLVELNTDLVELLSHPGGVGVYDLADEQFVTYGYNFTFRHFLIFLFAHLFVPLIGGEA
jgi:hypothetical protein